MDPSERSFELNGFFNWFISFRSPYQLYSDNVSLLIVEIIFLFGALVSIVHAFHKKGRLPYLLLASVLHGFNVELLSYYVPDIDNFWHSQSMVMFMGRRLPIYVICLYPVFYYQSNWAASKLNLKGPIVSSIAIGLLTVLIDIPYDIIGVKYLLWTWHDTDPNIEDRHYHVPWNSYYFHLTFAASFTFFFHLSRGWFDKRKLTKWEAGTVQAELCSVMVAAICGMPGGCLLFIPLYHPLHDYLGIHSEVSAMMLLFISMTFVWKFERRSDRTSKSEKLTLWDKSLLIHLFLHYMLLLAIVIFVNPKEMISTGVHEPIGNCSEKVKVQTILKTLEKRKYLCVTDYNEPYFDFHCANQPVLSGNWYKICGTDFENKAEYVVIISFIVAIASVIFSSVHFDRTQSLSPAPTKKLKLT